MVKMNYKIHIKNRNFSDFENEMVGWLRLLIY